MVYHISYLHLSKHAPLVGAICHLALALLYGSVKKKPLYIYKNVPSIVLSKCTGTLLWKFSQKVLHGCNA